MAESCNPTQSCPRNSTTSAESLGPHLPARPIAAACSCRLRVPRRCRCHCRHRRYRFPARCPRCCDRACRCTAGADPGCDPADAHGTPVGVRHQRGQSMRLVLGVSLHKAAETDHPQDNPWQSLARLNQGDLTAQMHISTSSPGDGRACRCRSRRWSRGPEPPPPPCRASPARLSAATCGTPPARNTRHGQCQNRAGNLLQAQ